MLPWGLLPATLRAFAVLLLLPPDQRPGRDSAARLGARALAEKSKRDVDVTGNGRPAAAPRRPPAGSPQELPVNGIAFSLQACCVPLKPMESKVLIARGSPASQRGSAPSTVEGKLHSSSTQDKRSPSRIACPRPGQARALPPYLLEVSTQRELPAGKVRAPQACRAAAPGCDSTTRQLPAGTVSIGSICARISWPCAWISFGGAALRCSG